MTVEEYFEEWWTPKELPENGFNKTAMLDFAEMYHNKALRIHDVVGRSEQLLAFLEWYDSNVCQNDCRSRDELVNDFISQ